MEKVSHDHNLKNFQVHIKKKNLKSRLRLLVRGTAMALQKSREQQLSRRAGNNGFPEEQEAQLRQHGESSEESEDERCLEKKEKEMVETGEG